MLTWNCLVSSVFTQSLILITLSKCSQILRFELSKPFIKKKKSPSKKRWQMSKQYLFFVTLPPHPRSCANLTHETGCLFVWCTSIPLEYGKPAPFGTSMYSTFFHYSWPPVSVIKTVPKCSSPAWIVRKRDFDMLLVLQFLLCHRYPWNKAIMISDCVRVCYCWLLPRWERKWFPRNSCWGHSVSR